jgi:hypothetical protein
MQPKGMGSAPGRRSGRERRRPVPSRDQQSKREPRPRVWTRTARRVAPGRRGPGVPLQPPVSSWTSARLARMAIEGEPRAEPSMGSAELQARLGAAMVPKGLTRVQQGVRRARPTPARVVATLFRPLGAQSAALGRPDGRLEIVVLKRPTPSGGCTSVLAETAAIGADRPLGSPEP